jgi:hypothetical protein
MELVVGHVYKIKQYLGKDSVEFPPARLMNAHTFLDRWTYRFQIDTYRDITLSGDDRFDITDLTV